jgi:hypothetical protein
MSKRMIFFFGSEMEFVRSSIDPCVWQAFLPSFSFFFSSFFPKKSNSFLHINKQLSSLFFHKKFKTPFTFISHQSILMTIPGKIKWQKALPNIPRQLDKHCFQTVAKQCR